MKVAPGLLIGGKYELLSVLGEGGMGTVWAANHLGLNQTVALKIISQAFARSTEARTRFDQEAKAAARLKSRYVVRVFDNGELPDGTPYMAMELLEGESLAQRLARGTLPLAEAAGHLSQIARALDRAHALGIVHRDIKPENIFLARSHDDDDGVVVKVLDFGIAKIASPESSPSHTRTGVLMGTPLFMSPEQARGLKSLDHRSDLYSLGLVTFTMLTGRNPFGGETLVDLMVQICSEPLPSIVANGHNLPPDLDAWLERACHREPSLRFGTGRELTEAFLLAARLSGTALLAEAPPGMCSLPELDGVSASRADRFRGGGASASVTSNSTDRSTSTDTLGANFVPPGGPIKSGVAALLALFVAVALLGAVATTLLVQGMSSTTRAVAHAAAPERAAAAATDAATGEPSPSASSSTAVTPPADRILPPPATRSDRGAPLLTSASAKPHHTITVPPKEVEVGF